MGQREGEERLRKKVVAQREGDQQQREWCDDDELTLTPTRAAMVPTMVRMDASCRSVYARSRWKDIALDTSTNRVVLLTARVCVCVCFVM